VQCVNKSNGCSGILHGASWNTHAESSVGDGGVGGQNDMGDSQDLAMFGRDGLYLGPSSFPQFGVLGFKNIRQALWGTSSTTPFAINAP
jgi:hypothetical protein